MTRRRVSIDVRARCALLGCCLASATALAAFTPPDEIVVVTDFNYPPYLFSADDELRGIIRDKWELWSRKTGVRAHVVGMTWTKAQQAVQQGTADVIETLTHTEARTALYEFSPAYAPVQAHVYFHHSISGISDVGSMRGFTIGAKESSACASWLAERGVDMLRFYATSESLVQAAGNGDVRLFCMDSMTAQYYLFKLELADEFLVSPPLYSNYFHWAVKKGNTELRDFIQGGFDRFTTQELEDINAAWIGNPLRFPIATRYWYYVALVAILVIIVSVVLIVWNRWLRARVAARTGELRNALMSLEQAVSGGNVGLFDWEVQTERVHYSREWKRQIGYADNEIADDYREWRDRVHPDDLERVLADVKRNLESPAPDYRTEFRFRHKDGSYRWILTQASVQRDADGKPVRMLGSHVDITERKLAEERVGRLNRVYAMLSGINSVIVRAHDWHELFEETCRLAVVAGKFRLAWASILERDPQRLVPVASESAGEFLGQPKAMLHHDAEYLERTTAMLERDAAERKGMSWRAIANKQAVYSNDIEHDTQVVLTRDLLLARGIRALAVLPLIVADEVVGVVALHAAEAGVFDDAEMELLRELAGDIAFGLDHIRKEERITYLAYYDSLTGLANRSLCHERLTQFIHAGDRDRRGLALCVVDLDHFKDVNDALGRQTGDALLAQFARRLLDCVDNGDHVARLGADRFAVVLPNVDSEHEVMTAIEAILAQCVSQPFHLGDTDLRIAVKVGIALYPNHGTDADTLLRNAEAALKKAKGGGEPCLVYTQKMTERVGEKVAMKSKLRRAREHDEFVLHYQPKVDAQRRHVTGVEALIRWLDPETGTIMPSKFVSLLEDTGLILDVGNWAIRRAIEDRARWTAEDVAPPRVAVNVSSVQLRQRNFVNIVRDAVALAEPAGIDIEITESVIMTDIEGNIAKLREIHELGVNIAIDDFGTGYSSLAYLARLPVQVLKIDVHFIARITADPAALTLVTTMVSLAHSLGLTVVAEGVETEKQAILLRQIRCDELQGYLISPAMTPERMVDFLKANR